MSATDAARQAVIDADHAVVDADEVDVVGRDGPGQQGDREKRDHRDDHRGGGAEVGAAGAGAGTAAGPASAAGARLRRSVTPPRTRRSRPRRGARRASLAGLSAHRPRAPRRRAGRRDAPPAARPALVAAACRRLRPARRPGLPSTAGSRGRSSGERGQLGGRSGRGCVAGVGLGVGVGLVEAQHDDGDVVVAARVLGLAHEAARRLRAGSSTAASTAAIGRLGDSRVEAVAAEQDHVAGPQLDLAASRSRPAARCPGRGSGCCAAGG